MIIIRPIFAARLGGIRVVFWVIIVHFLAGSECSQKIPERNDQSHRLSGTRVEAEGDIEFSRLPGNGVDNDAADSNRIRRVYDSAARIAEQRAP